MAVQVSPWQQKRVALVVIVGLVCNLVFPAVSSIVMLALVAVFGGTFLFRYAGGSILRVVAFVLLVLSQDLPAARLSYHMAIREVRSGKKGVGNRAVGVIFQSLDRDQNGELDRRELGLIDSSSTENDQEAPTAAEVKDWWSADSVKKAGESSGVDVDADVGVRKNLKRSDLEAMALNNELCSDSYLKNTKVVENQGSTSFCRQYCEEVHSLSLARQSKLKAARAAHPIATLASQLVDNARAMDQSKKIDSLFKKRTCRRVLKSVDQTNLMADIFCIVWFVLSTALIIVLILDNHMSQYFTRDHHMHHSESKKSM